MNQLNVMRFTICCLQVNVENVINSYTITYSIFHVIKILGCRIQVLILFTVKVKHKQLDTENGFN